jgi:hypothetical protein
VQSVWTGNSASILRDNGGFWECVLSPLKPSGKEAASIEAQVWVVQLGVLPLMLCVDLCFQPCDNRGVLVSGSVARGANLGYQGQGHGIA